MLGNGVLSMIGVQVVQVRLSRGASISPVDIGVDHGHMRFCTDADRRVDEFQFSLRLAHFEVCFVFPSEVDVTNSSLNESGGCRARAGIQNRNLLVQLRYEIDRILSGSAAQDHRTPGAEEAQGTISRGLRVRSDD